MLNKLNKTIGGFLAEFRIIQIISLFIEGIFKYEMPMVVKDSIKLDNGSEVVYDFYVLPYKIGSLDTFKTSNQNEIPWKFLTKSEKLEHYKKEISKAIISASNGLTRISISIISNLAPEYKIENDSEILYQSFIHRNKIGSFRILLVKKKFEILRLKEIRENKLDVILS